MRISNNKCDHSYETFEARPHGYPEVLGVSAQVYCRAGSQSEGGDPIAAIQILAPIFGGSLLGIRVGMAREEALAVLRRNHADVHPEVRGGLPGETFLTADIPKGHPTKSEMTLYFSETGQVVSAELQDKRFAHMYFPSTTP
jgi:hypothetical protein